MNIRSYNDGDLERVMQLFTDSVHGLAADHYTEAQRAAWAPQQPSAAGWRTCLAPLQMLVAESAGELAGFVAFEFNGHIEFLYTSPKFSRQGVASRLYETMSQYLDSRGVKERFTEASLVARPFFERQGLRVVEEQHVERNGVVLRRFAMSR